MPSRPVLSDAGSETNIIANETRIRNAGGTIVRSSVLDDTEFRPYPLQKVAEHSLSTEPSKEIKPYTGKPEYLVQGQKSLTEWTDEYLSLKESLADLKAKPLEHQERALKNLEQALEEAEGETFLYVVGMSYHTGRHYAIEEDKVTFRVSPNSPGVLVDLARRCTNVQLGVVASSQTTKAKELIAKKEAQNKLLKGTLVKQIQHNGKTAWKVRVAL